jgi:hypothetical protein
MASKECVLFMGDLVLRHVFLFTQSCIFYYIYKCRYTYFILFLCLLMEVGGSDHKKQVDQENIMLKNRSTISRTNDEEMRHEHNLSNVNNTTNE